MTVTAESVAARIEEAFGDEPMPPPGDVLGTKYQMSIDAGELLGELRGNHWKQLSRERLFHHREMIRTLSATGYRAYIAAFLRAGLEDDRYGPDLRTYTVSSLQPLDDTPEDIEACRERLSLLTDDQKSAVVSYLRRVADVYDLEEAREVLDAWLTD